MCFTTNFQFCENKRELLIVLAVYHIECEMTKMALEHQNDQNVFFCSLSLPPTKIPCPSPSLKAKLIGLHGRFFS